MKRCKVFILVLITYNIVSVAYGAYYRWPLWQVPFNDVRGTYCEYRENHFHEGIDIPTTMSSVQSTTEKFKCIDFGDLPNGMKKFVTVQNYDGQTSIAEGSKYLHMDEINSSLERGEVYENVFIAVMTTFWRNHLHFEMREPVPVISDAKNSFNPFYYSSLCTSDGYKPVLIYLYADGDYPEHHGDAIINSWNFLGYDFMGYYDSTVVSPFIRLSLPEETRDIILDDPHIMISGNCKVRFVLKAKDEVTLSYPNCAPYWISLYLDADIADGSESNPFIDDAEPFYEVKFDDLENVFGQNEKFDEEDVYHTEPPLVSEVSPTVTKFYYRLYPNDSDLPGCILSGSSTVLETENLEEGQHRIRIVAKDYYGNIKTADAHFYIRTQEWVDYCRAFDN